MIYKQVFLVNQDLKMRKGKIAAQVAHVSFSWGFRVARSRDRKLEEAYVKWCLDGTAKVVLRATEGQVQRAINECSAIYVRDEGRTQVAPGSLTCCALPPMYEEDIPQWINEMKLL